MVSLPLLFSGEIFSPLVFQFSFILDLHLLY